MQFFWSFTYENFLYRGSIPSYKTVGWTEWDFVCIYFYIQCVFSSNLFQLVSEANFRLFLKINCGVKICYMIDAKANSMKPEVLRFITRTELRSATCEREHLTAARAGRSGGHGCFDLLPHLIFELNSLYHPYLNISNVYLFCHVLVWMILTFWLTWFSMLWESIFDSCKKSWNIMYNIVMCS